MNADGIERPFRVIIAGSRDFDDFGTLCRVCDHMLSKRHPIEVVCGMAKGADLLGKRYADERGHLVAEFPADWKSFGKSAGMIRNMRMAEYSDALIAFWDGSSRGTKNMIELAKGLGLKTKVHCYVEIFQRFTL